MERLNGCVLVYSVRALQYPVTFKIGFKFTFTSTARFWFRSRILRLLLSVTRVSAATRGATRRVPVLIHLYPPTSGKKCPGTREHLTPFRVGPRAPVQRRLSVLHRGTPLTAWYSSARGPNTRWVLICYPCPRRALASQVILVRTRVIAGNRG